MAASYCALNDVGVFEVTGSDARAFLNGQLSADLGRLPAEAAPPAAWCAANGRVRALVRPAAVETGYLLLAPAAMAGVLTGKLAMYVLRADVGIAASTTRGAAAVLDAPPEWLAARGLTRPAERDRTEAVGDTLWVHAAERLSYVVGPAAELEAVARAADEAPRDRIELAEIELGLPQIVPETAERFLPQMLDLDRLGGVAFDKGCYPGQEVIARTQNLGTVKRRLRRFAVADSAPPAAGAPICTAAGEDAGTVLRAARDAGRSELLAVVRLEALAAARLHAETPGGPELTELPIAAIG